MTREQAKQKLISLGVEEPTDGQISDYLNSINEALKAKERKQKATKKKLKRLMNCSRSLTN